MGRRRSHPRTSGKIVTSCKSSKILILSGMIMDQEAVWAPGLMGRVMVEEIPVQDSTVIRVDITVKVIRATKVVIIIRAISNSSSSSRVTRATRSS